MGAQQPMKGEYPSSDQLCIRTPSHRILKHTTQIIKAYVSHAMRIGRSPKQCSCVVAGGQYEVVRLPGTSTQPKLPESLSVELCVAAGSPQYPCRVRMRKSARNIIRAPQVTALSRPKNLRYPLPQGLQSDGNPIKVRFL